MSKAAILLAALCLIGGRASALSPADKHCLVQTVYHEAAPNASLPARLAIIQVVANRKKLGFAPTICAVVYAPHQFSWSRRARPMHGTQLQQAKDAVGSYVSGKREWRTRNATHFHATSVHPKWKNELHFVASMGGHAFYEPKSRSKE